MFATGKECWLIGNNERPPMRVKVVDAEKDLSGHWTYQLKDRHNRDVGGGRFFPQSELSNSGE